MTFSRQKSLTKAIALLIACTLLLTACGSKLQTVSASGGTPEVTELRYQGGVGSVTFPELAEDLGYLAPLKLKFIGNTISGPQDIQSVVTGDTDFGGAFNGAIVKLISAKAPIKPVIAYYGVDDNTWTGYYVLDGSPIKTAKDLIGKKIAVNTLGAHHEFVIKEYLHRAGLTAEEIKQVTLVVVPPVTTEQTLRAEQIDVAALGGVLRDKALERGGIHPLFKDSDLFGIFSAGSYVLTDKFIKANPNASRKFVEATAKAIEWARTTPREEVVARFEKIINERGRKEDTSTVKFWKSTGVAGKGGLISDKEFGTWIQWLVDEGVIKDGQLKLQGLYTNEFNPYANEKK
ncbi:ABC transporter substrate-binding protein [Paenibacillus aceris]|uniref:ABC-type nitrate/sulfonate/bicarbonate transport system substrate-binding protein n=1 Tax=Paenibacillus aceris TaxID=869555 RepID=A0ABS4HV17_9BACL|nr:ABC transporter substrate-binding protein [Paenibacillus aceris]MBP1962482.1 ABC-type nitrate/sulfonate/bicarbonate transport system substrate-binding protein [Paenibacillus aceris]NHW37296.1 ABC transporter substrate-binding protein [Paenibacillus aceris]